MAGSGTYVEVDEGKVDPWAITQKQLITSRFDATLALADDMQTKVDAYLASMEELVEDFELPSGWDDALGNVIITDNPMISQESIPDLDVNSYTNSTSALPVSDLAVPSLDITSSNPTVPLAVSEASLPTLDLDNSTPTTALPVGSMLVPSLDISTVAVEDTAIPVMTVDPAPSIAGLELPDNWPTIFPLLGALKAAPEIDLTVTEPTLPDEVNPSISHEDAAYSSELWLAAYNKVLSDIENGGTGLAPAVEQAIYDRAKERQRKENEDQYNKLMNAVGANGFNMPPGVVIAVQQTMAEELLRQAVDINEKIMIAQGGLAQKNTHFMVERAGAMEQILRDFHNNKENRTLDAEKAAGALVVQVYDANIKAYLGKWEGQKIKISAGVAKLDSVMKENELIIQAFQGELGAVLGKIEAISKQSAAEVNAYTAKVGAEVEAYKAETGAKVDVNNARIGANSAIYTARIGSVVDEYKMKIGAAIDEHKTKIGSETDVHTTRLGIEADEYKARVAASIDEFKTLVSATIDSHSTKIGSETSVHTARIGAATDEFKTLVAADLDEFKTVVGATVDGYKTKVGSETDVHTARINVSSDEMKSKIAATSQGYAVKTGLIGDWYDAMSDQQKAELGVAELELRKAVAGIESEIKGYVSYNDLQRQIITDMTNIASQSVASALNAVNANASMGYSGQESTSETWAHRDGITETHNFDETPD